MKIKVIILENDAVYLNRIATAFNVKYADKLEVYSFTEKETAIEFAASSKVDVFLANESIDMDVEALPSHCGFAYLVESMEIESIKNEIAICKFQKAELIYKQILSIFSEKVTDITGIHLSDGEGNSVIAFVSASGGVGSSVAAAACAMNFAKKGKKVLYLNLEKYGNADLFFSAEGVGNLGDIIYAIKSKKGNLSMKLESTVKQDASGVYFYSPTKVALDLAELKFDEVQKLIKDIKMFGGYEYIILDMDFAVDKNNMKMLQSCNKIVFVSDGSEIANNKLVRAMEAFSILDQQDDSKLIMRSVLLFNRFSSQTSQVVNIGEMKQIGGIKRFEGLGTKQLLQQVSENMVFDNLA